MFSRGGEGTGLQAQKGRLRASDKMASREIEEKERRLLLTEALLVVVGKDGVVKLMVRR